MLEEQEEKQIRRYCLYPKIAIAALLVALLIGVPFILLEMLDDLVFHHQGFTPTGLYVYLAIAAIYLFIFCWCILSVRFGMRGRQWKALQERLRVRQEAMRSYAAPAAGVIGMQAAARHLRRSDKDTALGGAAEVASAAAAVATAGSMASALHRNAREMAEAYRVEIPGIGKQLALFVLAPVLLLTAVYIPQYAQAKKENAAAAAQAAAQIAIVRDALEPVCEYVSADDPLEDVRDYGYSVIGYLRGMETDAPRCYVYVSFARDGTIEDISYDAELDPADTLADSLAHVEADFAVLHDALKDVDVPCRTPGLLREYTFPETFRQAFLAGSYYDPLYQSDTVDGCRVVSSFDTEPEEDFDEYTTPRVYLYLLED